MTTYTVSCYTPDNYDPDFRIQGVGGYIGLLRWFHSVDDVINNIEIRGDEYFVGEGATRARVIVKVHPTSLRKYITTEPDYTEQNNILNLPYCP